MKLSMTYWVTSNELLGRSRGRIIPTEFPEHFRWVPDYFWLVPEHYRWIPGHFQLVPDLFRWENSGEVLSKRKKLIQISKGHFRVSYPPSISFQYFSTSTLTAAFKGTHSRVRMAQVPLNLFCILNYRKCSCISAVFLAQKMGSKFGRRLYTGLFYLQFLFNNLRLKKHNFHIWMECEVEKLMFCNKLFNFSSENDASKGDSISEKTF